MILSTLCSLVMLVSCGDFGEKKVDPPPISDRRFEAGCKLSSDKLAEFFKEEIPGEIQCLKAHLDIFIKVVYSDRPGYLSKTELTRFIRTRDVMDNPDDILQSMDAVFSIANLLFGGPKDYIHGSDLNRIVEFAMTVNSEIIKIYDYIKDEQSYPYAFHRVHKLGVLHAAVKIKDALLRTYRKRSDEDRLDLFKLIDSFGSAGSEDKEKVKDLLFIKRYFLGGSPNILTNHELEVAINMIPTASEVLFDAIKLNKLTFTNDRDRFDLFEDGVIKFRQLMHYDRDSHDVIFTIKDIQKALRWYEEEWGLRISSYDEALKLIKRIFFDTDETFKARDFYTLEQKARDIFAMGRYFADIYKAYSSHLDAPARISINFNSYKPTYLADLERLEVQMRSINDQLANPDTSTELRQTLQLKLRELEFDANKVRILIENQSDYFTRFQRIVRNYRYFRRFGEDSAYFFNGFRRSMTGAFSIGMFEKLFKDIFNYFERFHPCDRLPSEDRCERPIAESLTLGQVKVMIESFKEFLYDTEIVLPGREEISAENTVLMSALFQNQSNDNGVMDIPEAVEFAVGIFTVAPLGGEIFDKVKNACEIENANNIDKWGRIEVNCFRKNFLYSFFGAREDGKQNLSAYYSKFNQYVNGTNRLSQTQRKEFVLAAERFTRPCKGLEHEDIPISKNDVIGIMGGLYNVETTLNRWDMNGNNIMDEDEVAVAYNIYEPAVKAIIEDMDINPAFLKGIIKGLHKQLFQYMIMYETVPDPKDFKSIWDFISFLTKFNKKAPATRLTIMAILKTLSVNSKAFRESTFDCIQVRFPPEP